jgi:hypothetical protein
MALALAAYEQLVAESVTGQASAARAALVQAALQPQPQQAVSVGVQLARKTLGAETEQDRERLRKAEDEAELERKVDIRQLTERGSDLSPEDRAKLARLQAEQDAKDRATLLAAASVAAAQASQTSVRPRPSVTRSPAERQADERAAQQREAENRRRLKQQLLQQDETGNLEKLVRESCKVQLDSQRNKFAEELRLELEDQARKIRSECASGAGTGTGSGTGPPPAPVVGVAGVPDAPGIPGAPPVPFAPPAPPAPSPPGSPSKSPRDLGKGKGKPPKEKPAEGKPEGKEEQDPMAALVAAIQRRAPLRSTERSEKGLPGSQPGSPTAAAKEQACPLGVPADIAKACDPDRKCDEQGHAIAPNACLACAMPGTTLLVKLQKTPPAVLHTVESLTKFNASLELAGLDADKKARLQTLAVEWLNEASWRQEKDLWFDRIGDAKLPKPVFTGPWDPNTANPRSVIETLERQGDKGVSVPAENITGSLRGQKGAQSWVSSISKREDGKCVLLAPDLKTFERWAGPELRKGGDATAAGREQARRLAAPVGSQGTQGKSALQCKQELQEKKGSEAVSAAMISCITTRKDLGPDCQITSTVCKDCLDATWFLETAAGPAGEIAPTNPDRLKFGSQVYMGLEKREDGSCWMVSSKVPASQRPYLETAANKNAEELEKQARQRAELAACASPDRLVEVKVKDDPVYFNAQERVVFKDKKILHSFQVPANELHQVINPEALGKWEIACVQGGDTSLVVLLPKPYKVAWQAYKMLKGSSSA